MSEQRRPMTTRERWARAILFACIITGMLVSVLIWDYATRETQVVTFATLDQFDMDAYIEEWGRDSDKWLTEQYMMTPWSADNVLFIEWPHSIHVTDSLSRTVTIAGPATVRFSEEE